MTESDSRSAVERRRHSNPDRDRPAEVLELIERRGERISAVRVFRA